jgi:polysaccharide export outer membrane protein
MVTRTDLPALIFAQAACVLCALIALGSCTMLSSAGPGRDELIFASQQTPAIARVVEIADDVTRKMRAAERRTLFSEALPVALRMPSYTVRPGDVLEVSIWEAPPAALFGATVIDPRAGVTGARASVLPEQMVAPDGSINVPFAGQVRVAGRSPLQIEDEIARRLRGKANQPQVLVRVVRNASSTITIVGEVQQSQRLALSAKGERVLDAIAAAGGTRQPVHRVTVQVTRGSTVATMPLERIIQVPNENVLLAPGDVVTLSFLSQSFTVLGATNKNEEIPFEGMGISLAQALARSGGIQDARGDARGIFVFRFEDPKLVPEAQRPGPATPEGLVPVVYWLDMKKPEAFLVSQNFPVRDKDVVYVANAPAAELQKFLNILTSSVFSVNSFVNLAR